MKPLIGIHGYAGVGKDTVANMIVEHLGNARRRALADPLKDGVATMFDVPREWMDDPQAKENTVIDALDMTVREALQFVGSEVGRQAHRDCWLRVLEGRWLNDTVTTTVIPDVRKPNEARWIRGHGGVVVEVARPGYGPSEHSTEHGLDRAHIDRILVNDAEGHEPLRERVWDLLAKMEAGL